MKKKSFSSSQKADIISAQIKNPCCRRAMLDGVLCAKGRINEDSIEISVENDAIAEYIGALIKEAFLKAPKISVPKSGGRCRIITFSSSAAEKYLANTKDKLSFIEICRQKCAGCHAFFWKGVFLSCGRVTDPDKEFLLEFSLGDHIEQFKSLFSEQEIVPLEIVRRSEHILYFKRKSDIQDFFATAGMNNTVFSLLDSFIKTEMRESANRISNCETHNIMRAVDASQKHVNAINDLIEANLLSSLPEELEKTAKLRLSNPDLTLSQLAAISVPPITKPGLSHRLNKILQMAEKKLGKKYS